MDWNIFRILADLSHALAKSVLIWAIHNNKSSEGVSLMFQQLYLLVFLCRYLPYKPWNLRLGEAHGGPTTFHYVWNSSLKAFYIFSSAYTIFIMMRVFPRTREREKAWKLGMATLVGSLVLSPLVMLVFSKKSIWSLQEYLWTFSIVLESVCVLPQLLLLRQTTVPTVIDSFYLAILGSYRALYELNWIVRAARGDAPPATSVIFGLVQTILYVDFAWVYFTRQRVKLRGGTVVDSDDLRQGWLVKRLLGRQSGDDDDFDAEGGHDGQVNNIGRAAIKSGRRMWGPRGISVSADELHDSSEIQGLTNPTNFEDEESDEEARPVRAAAAGAGNGSEWVDESRRS